MTTDGSAIIVDPVTGKKSTIKSDDSSLDYPFNWADWLAGCDDSYSSHVITVWNPPGVTTPLTASVGTQSGGVITTMIAGGTIGQTHSVTCKITTAATPPRIDERTLWVKIKAR
jgi:hypothetical protein